MVRLWPWESACVSVGRATPVYTSQGYACPNTCGFCVAEDTDVPSTRRNDPADEEEIKLPEWKDKDGNDYVISDGMVAIDNPDVPGGVIEISKEDYDEKKNANPKEVFALYFHRRDNQTQIGDSILSAGEC